MSAALSMLWKVSSDIYLHYIKPEFKMNVNRAENHQKIKILFCESKKCTYVSEKVHFSKSKILN